MSEQMLKRKRASVKARLTSFEKYLAEFKSTEDLENLDLTLDEVTLSKFEQKLLRAEQLLTEFDQIQIELEIMSDSEEYSEREEFENKYHSIIAEARTLFKKLNSQTNNTVESQVKNNCNRLNGDGVHLPTIKLAKFDGTYDQWLEFKDNFLDGIHSKTHLSNATKFQYLKGALTGEAAQVIKAIKVTSENYNDAWNLLCERFDDDVLLVDNHVNDLFRIEPVIRESSAKLREL